MSFDTSYEALASAADDARWAFGTQAPAEYDPLSGVDTAIPSGVDGLALGTYCLMLADDALIASHRLQEWCTNAPELEEELALANIGLDLLGQARLLLSRAGKAGGSDRGEDELAFSRAEREFRNVQLVELPRGDFGRLIAALLVFSTWRLALFQALTASRDPVLAAVAVKGVHELTYHRDYAAQWTVRLGDGTEYSHERMRAGLADVWPYVDELFTAHEVEQQMADAGVGVDPASVKVEFNTVLAQVLVPAKLERPEVPARPGIAGRTGRHGVHTEAMGDLLAELQSVARADPEATW